MDEASIILNLLEHEPRLPSPKHPEYDWRQGGGRLDPVSPIVREVIAEARANIQRARSKDKDAAH